MTGAACFSFRVSSSDPSGCTDNGFNFRRLNLAGGKPVGSIDLSSIVIHGKQRNAIEVYFPL